MFLVSMQRFSVYSAPLDVHPNTPPTHQCIPPFDAHSSSATDQSVSLFPTGSSVNTAMATDQCLPLCTGPVRQQRGAKLCARSPCSSPPPPPPSVPAPPPPQVSRRPPLHRRLGLASSIGFGSAARLFSPPNFTTRCSVLSVLCPRPPRRPPQPPPGSSPHAGTAAASWVCPANVWSECSRGSSGLRS